MCNLASKKSILILGGGFGGVATARHVERLFRRAADVEIVLVSRDNFVPHGRVRSGLPVDHVDAHPGDPDSGSRALRLTEAVK